MEAIGAFFDEEWESLSRLFSSEDAEDVLLHSNGSNIFSNNVESSSPTFSENTTVGTHESLYFTSNTFDPNFNCTNSQSENSTNSSSEIESINALFPNQGNEPKYVVTNNTFDQSTNFYSMDYNISDNSSMVPIFPDDMMEQILQLKAEILSNGQLVGNADCTSQPVDTTYEEYNRKENLLKRKHEAQDKDSIEDDNSSETPKKRRRSRPVKNIGQKSRRAAPSKRNKKIMAENSGDVEGESIGGENGESSSNNCTAEDNSNASQLEPISEGGSSSTTSESNVSLNSSGKARACRGSATDPQSLYARRRRERINERLKILQNLVPNGTKVDISTMLEEAVHYVKFLQLQIKLLSSDDMWMFAPIAYNGMDIGLYQKISPNFWPTN